MTRNLLAPTSRCSGLKLRQAIRDSSCTSIKVLDYLSTVYREVSSFLVHHLADLLHHSTLHTRPLPTVLVALKPKTRTRYQLPHNSTLWGLFTRGSRAHSQYTAYKFTLANALPGTPHSIPSYTGQKPPASPSSIKTSKMDATLEVARLVLRQESSASGTLPDAADTCEGKNSYDGRMGVRISAIFVILVGSLFGKSSDTTSCSVCTNSI
jgi:hypothetical protein